MNKIFILFFSLLAFGLSAQINDFLLPTGPGNATKIEKVGNNKFVVVGKGYGQAYALKLNSAGQPVQILRFKRLLGGTWSELTDMVFANGSYYMVGACDNCVPGSPSRKIVIIRTDENFRVLGVQKLDAPANTTNDLVLGWSKIEADGNNVVVMSQLSQMAGIYGTTTTDTITNFALTRLDQNLSIQYHKHYDYRQFDNMGDLLVANGNYYAMTWNPNYSLNAPLFGIGSEQTYVHVIEPATGNILGTWNYPGVGLSLSKAVNSTDIAIGGAVTTSVTAGPQATITRINTQTGAVIATNSFGNDNRADAIVDLQPTADGNFLASGAMNMSYPSLSLLLSSAACDFNQLVNPRDARVYRINGQTMARIGGERILQATSGAGNILSSSLCPLNADGTNFISAGYRLKNAHFYSVLPVAYCKEVSNVEQGNAVINERTELDAAAGTVALGLNPATATEGAFVNFTGTVSPSSVMVYDMAGKLVQQIAVAQEGRYSILDGQVAGTYTVAVINAKGETTTFRQVIR